MITKRLRRPLVPAVMVVLATCTLVAVGSPGSDSTRTTVERLQDEVSRLKARVAKLETLVKDREHEISELKKRIAVRPIPPRKQTVEIMSPKTGTKVVTYRVLVEGIARVKDLDGHHLYPVLDPVASYSLYVKPPIKALARSEHGYSFVTYVPLGTSKQEPTNEHYRIFIVMTKRSLEPGEVAKLPPDVTMSNAVVVKWVSKPPLEPPKERPTIEITAPKNNSQVGMEVIVEGVVRVDDLAGRWPCVGVHPMRTSLIWIQTAPIKLDKTEEGYRFRTRVFCGTKTQGIGEKFEIYALLAKRNKLKEGDHLDRLPKDVPVSPSVLVTRVRN